MARSPWRVRRLAKRLGVPEEACRIAVRIAERRMRWQLELICGIPGLACAWGWMLLVGRGSDALQDAGHDPFAWAWESGAGTITLVVLIYGVAGLFLIAPAYLTHYFILRHALRHYRGEPLCEECGYTLAGLQASDGYTACPECGASTRVRPT